eukprot:3374761-Prymnesium_polylepis.1
MRRAQSGKSSKKRTSPTPTTGGGVAVPDGPACTSPTTLHRAGAFAPPRAPNPALPALPKFSQSRRSCRSAGPSRRRAARARAAPPTAARTRDGTFS